MNNYDIMHLSFEELLQHLGSLAEDNQCDGSCDEEFPYLKCVNCEACRLFNEIDEILRNGIKYIQTLKYCEKNK